MILDIIITKNNQFFLILDKNPEFKYTKKEKILSAYDNGFYSEYLYIPFSSGAFAGRKFEIPMSDGTIIKASGQYWDNWNINCIFPTTSIGYNTIEELQKIYVFNGGNYETKRINEWLKRNKHSTNYDKYRQIRS